MIQKILWQSIQTLPRCALRLVSLTFALVPFFGAERPPFGILYINDGADYMGRGVAADREGLRRIIDGYADAGHRLLIYGVRSGLLTFNYKSQLPGEYFGEGYSDDLLRAHPGILNIRDMLGTYFSQGIDPFGEIVKRAQQRNVRILAQIRPNNFNPTTSDFDRVVNGRFYYEHPEYRIAGHTNWDYGKAEVRSYFIDVIEEILQKYPVDGLDIDFTQQPPFFHASQTTPAAVMNDFTP
jgi:hypothetical protein